MKESYNTMHMIAETQSQVLYIMERARSPRPSTRNSSSIANSGRSPRRPALTPRTQPQPQPQPLPSSPSPSPRSHVAYSPSASRIDCSSYPSRQSPTGQSRSSTMRAVNESAAFNRPLSPRRPSSASATPAASSPFVSPTMLSNTHIASSPYPSNHLATPLPQASLSTINSSGMNVNDVTRVQLLLRLMEVERRTARMDERLREQDELHRQRMSEIARAHEVSAERTAAALNRVSSAELLARECDIKLSNAESRWMNDEDALQRLSPKVYAALSAQRAEMEEEISRNITLRNATHHQELVGLMERQQEQNSKLIRAHEMSTQAASTKMGALENRFKQKVEEQNAKVAACENELQLLAQRNAITQARLQEMEQQHQQELARVSAQANETLQQALAPLKAQLASLAQSHEQSLAANAQQFQSHYATLNTHASQISNIQHQLDNIHRQLDSQAHSIDASIDELKNGIVQVQNSLMSVSDSLSGSMNQLRESMPSRTDVEVLVTEQSRLTLKDVVRDHVQPLRDRFEELHQSSKSSTTKELKSLRSSLADVHSSLNHHQRSVQFIEEQLGQIQARVIVASENAAANAATAAAANAAASMSSRSASMNMNASIDQQRQRTRGDANVATHATMHQHQPHSYSFASPQAPRHTTTPAATGPYSSPSISHNHSSLGPLVSPTPRIFGVSMHSSDIAALRKSPHTQANMKKQQHQQQHHQNHTWDREEESKTDETNTSDGGMRMYMNQQSNGTRGNAEEDFIANLLAAMPSNQRQ